MMLLLISHEPKILIDEFHSGAKTFDDSLPADQAFVLHLGKPFKSDVHRLYKD